MHPKIIVVPFNSEPMTTFSMTNQQRELANASLEKYRNALLMKGNPNDNFFISTTGFLIYSIGKGYLTVQICDSDNPDVIVSNAGSYEVDSKGNLYYFDRKPFIKEGKALVIQYPDNDLMAESIRKNIDSIRSNVLCHLPVLEFAEDILNIADGEFFYALFLDYAIKYSFSSAILSKDIRPTEFDELASYFLDAKDKKVLNPFSKAMPLITKLNGFESFTGIECDTLIWELGQYRTLLWGYDTRANAILADPLEWPDFRYDIIVSMPPMSRFYLLYGDKYRIDTLCFSKFEESTTPSGELLIITTPSVMSDSDRHSFKIRRDLTEKNYLEAIIVLPSNLLNPYTFVAQVVVILKKDRKKDAPIKMIDASSFYLEDKKLRKLDVNAVIDCFEKMPKENSAFVNIDDIREKDYIWDASGYVMFQTDTFPEGYSVIKLKKIVDLIHGEMQFFEKVGHLATISALSSDVTECVKPVEGFELSDDLSGARKVSEPVILISTIRDLKPTYCEASKANPIFLHPRVLALSLKNTAISPKYFCLELSRRKILPTGNSISRFPVSFLMEVKVGFPSLERLNSLVEQNNLFNEAMDNHRLAKAKELGLQSLIDKMKTEYINTVRIRKHDMMPYIREMGSVARRIRNYVENSGNPDLIQKTESLLIKFDSAFKGLSEIVRIFSQEDQFGSPEKVDIDKCLRDFVRTHKDDDTNFSIGYHRDDNALREYGITKLTKRESESSPLFIMIAPIDLERIIRNIYENAFIHGFTESSRKDYHLEIYLTVDPETNMYLIDFVNNGNPFPKGMDRERYGLLGEKAGTTGKTGQGGYIVKSTVEHFHGDYDVFMQGDNAVVRILFPIIDNDE